MTYEVSNRVSGIKMVEWLRINIQLIKWCNYVDEKNKDLWLNNFNIFKAYIMEKKVIHYPLVAYS